MKWLLVLLVFVIYVLHQDYWLWSNRTLVFGALPIGLAYHAGFCVVAACMMAVLVKCAWPSELEQSVTESNEELSEAAH